MLLCLRVAFSECYVLASHGSRHIFYLARNHWETTVAIKNKTVIVNCHLPYLKKQLYFVVTHAIWANYTKKQKIYEKNQIFVTMKTGFSGQLGIFFTC